jgi:poly-gamma-glutamate synthesis protein (capsule biosynthesis protein)
MTHVREQWGLFPDRIGTPLHRALTPSALILLAALAGTSALAQEAVPPSPSSTPSASKSVRLAFMGDVMLSRRVGKLLDVKGAEWALDACKAALSDCDLAIANLESPVGTGGKKSPVKTIHFRGNPEHLDALTHAGIGMVSLSNNHILDYGPDVLDQTITALEERGILHFGVRYPDDPHDMAEYVMIGEMTLAFLGYCAVCPTSFAATGKRAGLRFTNLSTMVRDVKWAKKKADFVIVMPHWGLEHKDSTGYQRKMALGLSEAGADLVIGSHPHVLQRITRVGKDGRTLLAYSLGNFLFDMKCRGCKDSCILKVDLEKGKRIRARFVPISGDTGRPEPVDPGSARGKRIKTTLLKGFNRADYD